MRPAATAPAMAAPRAQVWAERATFISQAGDVGVDLHDERVLLGDAAAVDDVADLHPVFFEPPDDGQGAEGGGLDEGPVDLLGLRAQGQADEKARSGAGRRGPCGCRCASRGRGGPDSPGARAAASRVSAAWEPFFGPPGSISLDEPVEDVADGGLSGLQAEVARQDRAVDDAAEAGHVGELLRGRPDADVAGARADDLDEAAGLDARADAAEVGVEGADGDGDPGAQAELLGPVLRQAAGGDVGRYRSWRRGGRGARPGAGRAWPGTTWPEVRPSGR
ncbi:MAG: hypothetical protein MZV63_65385 [Marinilabiliales bacterium]|nr:hypothetical protein [Marinilabiliales bacterium]